MRTIKFRVWNEHYKSMNYNPSLTPVCATLNETLADVNGGGIVIMQFTGLLDKNGREIYEGDVCNIEFYGKCVIIFNVNVVAFQYQYLYLSVNDVMLTNTLYECDACKYEVIGNIYER